MIHPKYKELLEKQEQLLARPNEINSSFYNGVYDRYQYPVITRHHVPLHWRFDLDETTNPHFMERLGINATLNPGAIYFNGKYIMVIRTEGLDRKSIFALAESDNGIDGFRFTGKPLVWDDIDADETNQYDMRLVQHEDGWIYGIYCSERKDPEAPAFDTSSAVAQAGLVRTRILQAGNGCPTSPPIPLNSAMSYCTRNSWMESMPSTPVHRTDSSRQAAAAESPLACVRIS